jgi:hypothetical protein
VRILLTLLCFEQEDNPCCHRYALDRNFWRTDCAKVLHEIGESFEQILTARGCQIEDKIKFAMFQLVSDNFAVIALHDKELRKIAGIRKGLFYKWRQLFCFCSPFPENTNFPRVLATRDI